MDVIGQIKMIEKIIHITFNIIHDFAFFGLSCIALRMIFTMQYLKRKEEKRND